MALNDVKLEQEKYLNRENCFATLARRNNEIDQLKSWLQADSSRIGTATSAQLQSVLGITATQAQTLLDYKMAADAIVATIGAQIAAGRLISGQISAEPIFTA